MFVTRAPWSIPVLTVSLFAAGCGGVVDDGVRPALAPLVGKADATDVADHECRVVLRRADRVEGSPALVAATFDVDAKLLADPGATPAVLFRADGATSWSQVTAAAFSGGPAGFTRYIARFPVATSA